jgi:pyruvate,orthophosphate dikinase
MKVASEAGRATRPGLKLGICGEHGGDPSSVEFCHQLGLDYVSCSPYRLPIARLAAAQAVLREAARRKAERPVRESKPAARNGAAARARSKPERKVTARRVRA